MLPHVYLDKQCLADKGHLLNNNMRALAASLTSSPWVKQGGEIHYNHSATETKWLSLATRMTTNVLSAKQA